MVDQTQARAGPDDETMTHPCLSLCLEVFPTIMMTCNLVALDCMKVMIRSRDQNFKFCKSNTVLIFLKNKKHSRSMGGFTWWQRTSPFLVTGEVAYADWFSAVCATQMRVLQSVWNPAVVRKQQHTSISN
jgi:hypothetical protein